MLIALLKGSHPTTGLIADRATCGTPVGYVP